MVHEEHHRDVERNSWGRHWHRRSRVHRPSIVRSSLAKNGATVHQHICKIHISDFTTYPRRREVWSCRRSFCEMLGGGERREMVAAEQVVCGYHASDPYEMNVRLAAHRSLRLAHPRYTRSFFGLFKRKEQHFAEPKPLLSEDSLFHSFSKSPFPAIRARGEAIKQLAPCPVCSSSHKHVHAHTKAKPEAVSFECPDCGWPTHCSEEHWSADQEHQKYCSRLREVNEDEHDLRSGRKLHEFDLPGTTFPISLYGVFDFLTGITGPQDFETAISFANWDVFWYTRGFPSINTERSRRHSSKLLTYPMTIGSVLHQYSGLTLGNQRLTSEGSRSLAGRTEPFSTSFCG